MWKLRHAIVTGGKAGPVCLAFWLSVCGSGFVVRAQSGPGALTFPLVTNVVQLRHVLSGKMGSICQFSLAGTLLAVNAGSGRLFFQDDSGTEVLETSLAGQNLRPGQRIQLWGTNYVTTTAMGVSLGKLPVVDNDGEHSDSESTATVYLQAGRHPIQVQWFNHLWNSSLRVDYAGPDFTRRPIPETALWRPAPGSPGGAAGLLNGLNYRCYEGEWVVLPPFASLVPVKSGETTGFDLRVKTREERVGLVFDGWLKIDRDGLYIFYLDSDDGSQLTLDSTPLQWAVTGVGGVPPPRPLAIRQPLSGDPGAIWAEVEGEVTFLGRQGDQAELELTSDDAPMRLTVGETPQAPPRYLLGSRVRVRGVCPGASRTGTPMVADTLVAPNWGSVQVLEVAPEFWSGGQSLKIRDGRSLKGMTSARQVRLRGRFRSSGPELLPVLEDATGSLPIELLNGPPPALDEEVECMGRWSGGGSSSGLREAVWRELPKPADVQTEGLPLLTTAAQVQQLNRIEAQRGYRAKIRGVVTWVAEKNDCVVLQDATRGVFVGIRRGWKWESPRVGERLEVEGKTVAGEFSPIIILNQGERLGMGRLPVPKHPARDQLISGSMDSQYVEIRGLVTGVRDKQLTLLMAGGKVEVEFDPKPPDPLEDFLHSVVRIRGCLFAKWDHTTLQVTPDHPLWFGNATVCVDCPPPLDPFAAGKLRVRELMQFDAQEDIFRRVMVSGQVLGDDVGLYYLCDHGCGLRFQPVPPVHFEPGDLVDVVGLVELGGPSPVLREAVARKTGQAPLPAPQPLILDRTNAPYDATRVWVEGLLVDSKRSGARHRLEIQVGLKSFVAWLSGQDDATGQWPVGGRLKLTGVFSDLSGDWRAGHDVSAFELLLSSPTEVEVMARPPWWTLNRLLAMVAMLAAGLGLAFLWISLLRRQVERRTVQLEREISERQRAEQDRVIEQERSRIARDLHDDLGSSLTAINMLAMPGRPAKPDASISRARLELIADKTRLMVTTLDELVWAVNPKNDTLAALGEYLASYAEEMLARTDIVCRVELPVDFPAQTLMAETRHNVLLAVREALNNAVRHGRPGEVLLQLTVTARQLEILIQDNGCGFDPAAGGSGNGLANLRERMRKVNGGCRLQSSPGRGTAVHLSLPL